MGFLWGVLGKVHGHARTGPVQDLGGTNGQGPFDLAMGKPWAIPYGAHTGSKRGFPLPGLAPVCPWCPVPIPYGISPGTLSGDDQFRQGVNPNPL